MTLSTLTAISSIDGRYGNKTQELQSIFSEFGLIKYRVVAEIRWLQALLEHPQIRELPNNTPETHAQLETIIANFSLTDAESIKKIEATTNHDVKAVEYFIKQRLAEIPELTKLQEFVHFACTSEDINNVAYALMIQQARETVLLPHLDAIIHALRTQAHEYSAIAMLAHTHGQAASPTTLGKEIANVVARLQRQRTQIANIQLMGKMNGAVGNFNAHYASYPNIHWQTVARQCINECGLNWNPYTTQIEPHDYIAELSHALIRCNNILIDYARDTWLYISKGYFKQVPSANEVGSSTMPHKVNPIDFENAEGNLGMANAVFQHLANDLTKSRLQRDLSDSTLLRNLGVGFAHSLIGLKSLQKGMVKLAANPHIIQHDLDHNWTVLGEAIQTVMRRHGLESPYEQLKTLTRGQRVDQETLIQFIDGLALNTETKQALKQLTPQTYTGIAAQLAREI